MKMQLALLAMFGLGSVAGLAHAQSTLDKYLAKSTQGSAASATGEANVTGINKVYSGAEGFWRLDDGRVTGGSCAITYADGSSYAGYVGPAGKTKDAFIVFNGPAIPPIKAGKNKTLTLTTASDGKAQTVQAFHAPNSAKENAGIIFFRLTDIQAATADISDAESVAITMDGKQVFSIKWKGGHKARASMQSCLSGAVGA